MNYKLIEEKHKNLIDIGKNYMAQVTDLEHDMNHIKDVIDYIKMILDNVNDFNNIIDAEVCIIAGYWHDVGRIEKDEGHEELSSKMIIDTMQELGYEDAFTKKCAEAIRYHGYNMFPKTKEGLIVQDADKIAWLGSRRWKNCLENRKKLESIIEKLPKLRNETLHFECSRRIYDKEIVKITTMLYHEIYGNNIIEKLKESDIELQVASIENLDEIIELYSERSSWFEENGIDQWSNYLTNHPKEEFIQAINNNNYYMLKKKNELIGGFELSNRQSFWEENKDAYYIYKVVTKVGHRDLGKYIFGLCEEFARKDNKKYLRLECKADNIKLNNMYEDYGFKFVRTGQDYYNYNLRERELN